MYLLIDIYGVVYKTNSVNISLKEMSEDGDITIIEVQDDNPKVFIGGNWLDIEIQEGN